METQDLDLFFNETVQWYVSNRRFLRRDWLTSDLAARMAEPDCRIVLLTAEPGAGKSALVAQLADDHPDWLRYFIRRDQHRPLADVSAHSFLLRIGFQLAALHPELFALEQIKISADQRVADVSERAEVVAADVKRIVASPFHQIILKIEQQVTRNQGKVVGLRAQELVVDPRLMEADELMHSALLDPAKVLQRLEPDRQIVVLIDALDEIRYHHTTSNILEWLTGCPALPANIRFILTSRPPDASLVLFSEKQSAQLRRLEISEDAPQVQADVAHFVGNLINDPVLRQALGNDAVKTFAALATQKARGNLGYLDALARGIETAIGSNDRPALHALLTLKEMPADLQGLYGFFLNQIRSSVDKQAVEVETSDGESQYLPAWSAVFRPLLGVLAVALEPLDLKQLQTFAGIKAEWGYVTAAAERLRQFTDAASGQFRLYHATVAEFLTDTETRERPQTAGLYVDAAKWNRQIANHYWQRFHANWGNLDDEYGLDHLAHHLELGGEGYRLQELISSNWMAARYAGSNSYSGFLSDLELAWQQAAVSGAASIKSLVRLNVIRALIGQQVTAYTDADLEILVLLGRVEEAIDYARLRRSADTVGGLITIFNTLNIAGTQRAELLDEAELKAPTIVDEQERSAKLEQLAKVWAGIGHFAKAASLAKNISEENARASSLLEIVSLLVANGRLEDAAAVVRAIELHTEHTWALQRIEAARGGPPSTPRSTTAPEHPFAALISSLERLQYFDAANATRKFTEQTRCEVSRIESVFTASDDAALITVLVWAADRAATSENSKETPASKNQAASGVPPDSQIPDEASLAAAAATIETLTDVFWQRSQAQADYAETLGRAGRFENAAKVAHGIADLLERHRTFRALVIMLARSSRYEEALALAQEITDDWLRLRALAGLASLCTTAGRFDIAESAARLLPAGDERAEALTALVQALLNSRREDHAKSLARGSWPARLGARLAAVVARFQIEAKRFEDAEVTVGEIPELFGDFARDSSLVDLSKALAEAGKFEDARRIADLIPVKRSNHSQALAEITKAMAIGGQLERALELRPAIDTQHLSWAMRAATTVLLAAQRFEEAARTLAVLDGETQRWLRVPQAAALAQASRFKEAEEIAQAIDEPWPRFCAFSSILIAELNSGVAAGPDSIVREILNGEFCAQVVAALKSPPEPTQAVTPPPKATSSEISFSDWNAVEKLIEARRFDEAETVARSDSNEWHRMHQLRVLAAGLARAGQARAEMIFDEISQIVRGGIDQQEHSAALRALAIAFAQGGHPQAERLFQHARQHIESLADSSKQEQELPKLVEALCKVRRFEVAQQLTSGISRRPVRQYAIRSIASALSSDGRLGEAQALVRAMREEDPEDGAHRSVVNALAEVGYVDEARQLAQQARTIPGRDFVSNELPGILASRGLFDAAWEELQAIRTNTARVHALCGLATALARASNDRAANAFEEAAHIAQFVMRSRDRDDGRTWVITALGEAGWFDKASELARAVESDSKRTKVLSKVAELRAATLAGAGQFEQALITLGQRSLDSHIRAIAEWAPSLDRVDAGLSLAAVREAIGVAAWTRDEWRRIHELIADEVTGATLHA